MTTGYTICPCCGERLDVMEQKLPRRTLVLVTCKNENCHPALRWQTVSIEEHQKRWQDVLAARKLAEVAG